MIIRGYNGLFDFGADVLTRRDAAPPDEYLAPIYETQSTLSPEKAAEAQQSLEAAMKAAGSTDTPILDTQLVQPSAEYLRSRQVAAEQQELLDQLTREAAATAPEKAAEAEANMLTAIRQQAEAARAAGAAPPSDVTPELPAVRTDEFTRGTYETSREPTPTQVAPTPTRTQQTLPEQLPPTNIPLPDGTTAGQQSASPSTGETGPGYEVPDTSMLDPVEFAPEPVPQSSSFPWWLLAVGVGAYLWLKK